jgi:hypothetical protein
MDAVLGRDQRNRTNPREETPMLSYRRHIYDFGWRKRRNFRLLLQFQHIDYCENQRAGLKDG